MLLKTSRLLRVNFGGLQVNFRGAIFDADGTLIDSMGMWHSLGRKYLDSLGIAAEKNIDAVLYAMSFEQGCEYLRKNYLPQSTEEEIKAGIFAMIEDFYRYEVKLKPGIADCLERLRQRNIPMVIATVGDRELLSSALERNHIAGYFREIFTGGELNTTKHEPEIYFACAEYLGMKPENIAVFEDSLYALETAKNAGFIVYGVRDESNLYDTGRIKASADYYVEEWK